jgi:hypothetical protein
MSNPNLLSLTTVNGIAAPKALTNTAADIIAAVTSGHCYHMQSILASNITAAAHPVSVFHKIGGTSYSIATSISVPANSTIEILGRAIYLQDGDSLTGNSDASSQITVVAYYEDLV